MSYTNKRKDLPFNEIANRYIASLQGADSGRMLAQVKPVRVDDERPGRQLKKNMNVESQVESLSREEKEKRAQITNLLKIAEAISVDFVSGQYIDPLDPVAADRRQFTWKIKDISTTGIELDLTFKNPLYISTGDAPDTLIATFNMNELYMDAENALLDVLPNGW